MRWACAILLAGCASTRSEHVAVQAVQAVQEHATAAESTLMERGPVTTVVEEFSPAGGAPLGDRQIDQNSTQPAAITANDVIGNRAPLLLRRTTITQAPVRVTHFATEVADKHVDTKVATVADVKSSTRPAFGCALGLGILIPLLIVGGLALWRFQPWTKFL